MGYKSVSKLFCIVEKNYNQLYFQLYCDLSKRLQIFFIFLLNKMQTPGIMVLKRSKEKSFTVWALGLKS